MDFAPLLRNGETKAQRVRQGIGMHLCNYTAAALWCSQRLHWRSQCVFLDRSVASHAAGAMENSGWQVPNLVNVLSRAFQVGRWPALLPPPPPALAFCDIVEC